MKKHYFILLMLFFGIFFQIYAKNPLKHQFKLDGKIDFKSLKDNKIKVGLYGAKLQLWFLNKQGDPLVPATFYLYQDQMKTTVKVDGSFSFDFEMYVDLKECTQLAIEIVPASDGGSIVYDQAQYIIQTSYGKASLINSLNKIRAVVSNFDGNSTTHFQNYQIEVSNRMGYYLRSLTISREYTLGILKKMGSNMELPPVPVHFEKPALEGAAAEYVPVINAEGDKIRVLPSIAGKNKNKNKNVLYHEYGHYLVFLFYNPAYFEKQAWNNTSFAYMEGCAEFFGMAAMNYGAAMYGDDNIDSFEDQEASAFQTEPFSKTSYSNVDNGVPRFASYLWNIYDGPTQPYTTKIYKNMDNDDVDGHKYELDVQIFKTIKQVGLGGYVTPAYFHANFLKNTPAPLSTSIEKIYQFTVVKGGDKAFPMRQVPVKSVVIGNASLGFMSVTVNLQHYPSTNIAINHALNDKKQALHDYKIYKKVNGFWQTYKTYKNIASLDNKTATFSLEDDFGSTQLDYKLTPINASGESLEAVEFSYLPMSVSITGNKTLYADEKGKFTANIKTNNGNGIPYYTYRWYLKTEDAFSYDLVATKVDIIGQKQDNSLSMYAPEGKSFYLKVEVEDTEGVKVSSYHIYVKTTVRKLDASIKGPTNVFVYDNAAWTANIQGGIPPYKLVWVSKIGNNYSNMYVGDSYVTKSGENFTVVLGITDAKGAIFNQQLAVKVLPMQVSIKGEKLTYLHKKLTWQPTIKGGEGFFKVVWGMKKEGDNLFWPISNAYFLDQPFESEGVYYLRVWVEDKNGMSAQSEDFKVTVLYQPPYIVINGPEEIMVGEGKKISHKLEGGKGPFAYAWKLFDTNNNFIKNLGLSEGTLFIPSGGMQGDYIIQLEVKDLYNNQTFYGQHAVKVSPSIPEERKLSSDDTFLVAYPNPANTTTQITYVLTEAAQVEVKIYDSQGGITLTPKNATNRVGENVLQIDVSTWKADTYLVKFMISTPQATTYYTTRIVVK